MGVDRRDYMYEDRHQRALSGWWTVLSVSHKLVVINVAVFLLWQLPGLKTFMFDHFTVGWAGVFVHGRVWTLFTSAISHFDLWHLLWNMLYLHWFGPDLEQVYGRRNFLALYVLGALVSSLTHAVWSHHYGADVPALGASGAVMAVVVVAAMFFPHRTIYFMMFLPVPLWLLACFKLVGDLAGLAGGGGGVAHAAHLGGAALGLLFKVLDLRLFGSPGQPEAEGARWRLPRILRLPQRPAEAAPAPPTRSKVDEATAQRVDLLLEKISREGMASLTPDELAFLQQASQRYKR